MLDFLHNDYQSTNINSTSKLFSFEGNIQYKVTFRITSDLILRIVSSLITRIKELKSVNTQHSEPRLQIDRFFYIIYNSDLSNLFHFKEFINF